MNILSPIVLFVYNRPLHTKRTIDALKNNILSNQSELYIYSDGPRNPHDGPSVREVRNLIQNISGFRSVSIVERTENYGLSRSIIDGVTNMCEQFGSVIVLEDDIVTSPYFLQYMNEAMELYQNESRVISICGYTYPVEIKLPETFFLRGADCWGWGTWQRGWALFNSNAKMLLESMEIQHLEYIFDFNGSYDYSGLLRSQASGKRDSWAVRWYASAFLENMLTLYPGRSLVLNIGMDGSGVHGSGTKEYISRISESPIIVDRSSIIENPHARAEIGNFLGKQNISMLKRAIKKLLYSLNDLFARRTAS